MDSKQEKKKEKQKIQTKVKCPDCGKEFDVEIEIPEPAQTPKMAWEV